MQKDALSAHPIHELIAARWSARAIDPQRPLARETLLSLLEAARWAPSCFGEQPWRYIVWDRFRNDTAWQQAFDCLTEGNQAWARNAPILMLSLAHELWERNGKPNRWARHDTGAASENLCLQAIAAGLVAHQMGGFDADAIRRAFSIPNEYTPMGMIAVGHPASPDLLPDGLREKELAPRSRRPLSEIAFMDAWMGGMTDER